MTNKEIIRALELYYEEDNDMLLTKEAAKEALDLLKREREEKEALIAGQETLQKLISEKNAEIDRLSKHYKEYGFCNLLGNVLVYSKNLKDYNDMRKGLKAEAHKEFAEEFEKRCIASGVYPAVIKNILKNLIEEIFFQNPHG